MNLTLHVWRQASRDGEGRFVQYETKNISADASFLEMLDVVNEQLIEKGEAPIAFEHDCREGICGSCGMMINGVAHGPNGAAQLFTAAKISHLGLLPQGQPERYERVVRMVEVMEEHFGSCTMFGECEAVCPKGISIDFIARMNGDFLRASLRGR